MKAMVDSIHEPQAATLGLVERQAPLCADCLCSEVYALQARAHCAHPLAAFSGRVLFAGQPACADFIRQPDVDLRLAVFNATRRL
jgi:hypothetical protein